MKINKPKTPQIIPEDFADNDNLPGTILGMHMEMTGRDYMTREEFIAAVEDIEQEFHIDLSRIKNIYDDKGENDAVDKETTS